jgi:NAD(P)-dependent dehydrogenase (short-subunit alcohol dehydrogenase family)
MGTRTRLSHMYAQAHARLVLDLGGAPGVWCVHIARTELMMRLKDKIAIVTGASRGIGAEIARMFSAEGAAVVCAARNMADLEAVQDSIRKEGGRCTVMKVDVRARDDLKKMAEDAFSRYGAIDILVNNAGLPLFGHEIDDPDRDTEERFEAILETNLKGYWYAARFVTPFMKKRKKGSIVNISSVRGHAGLSNESVYCAAKGGVLMFTRALAVELAPSGIRVNSVSPGAIQVQLGHWVRSRYGEEAHKTYVERFSDVHMRGMELNQPIRMVGVPRDVGYAAVYFASDESRFVTGSDLLVDGGLTAVLPEPGALDMESLTRLHEDSREMREWFSTLR